MEIIIIIIVFFVVWKVLISLAKSSDAYLEFIVNGIKPEIDKLIQNQPITRKYVQNLNSLQQWKKFSAENYLKKRFEEDKHLQESIKDCIPIFKKKIAYYQSSYDRILSEFRFKKPQLKWYVSFKIEKDIQKSQQRFINSNYNNMFDIEWCYTSPQGRNSYESSSKFTIYQVSRVLSQLEENKASKVGTKYQESQIVKSSSNDSLNIAKSNSFNNYKGNSIIDVAEQSFKINSNRVLVKFTLGVPEWKKQYVYSFSEINQASDNQKGFYNVFKNSFLNGIYYNLYKNTNYAFILLFDLLNEYDNHKSISTLENQLKILEECYPVTKPYCNSFIEKKRQELKIKSSPPNNSIIDVTGQSFTINSSIVLNKYILDIPEWKNQYIYSFSEINQASDNQKEFYNIFKNSFTNGIYYDLFKNTNYAFVLINDFKSDYEKDKNLLKLENQVKKVWEIYPDTKPYGDLILKQKKEEISASSLNNINTYSNDNFNNEYWKLGDKYKSKLNLSSVEINLLNKLNNPNDNFCNIEFCLLEVCKLYLAVFSELNIFLTQNSRSLEEELRVIADTIAKKDFKYRKGSQNYNYCTKKIMTNEFFDHIFKRCDKALREYYDIKGKINTDTYFINSINSIESYNNIISKVDDSLNSLILKVNKPTKEVEVELNSYFTTRWRVLYSYITNNYDNNNNRFVESIIELGNLNIKNPSIQNIYFDASKFICKLDREASIQFYFYYLYYDLKSPVLKNKPLTKYMYTSLFSSKQQLANFEITVSELIKDKDLEKALKKIPEIYKVKRKKLQLNRDSIKEVIEQHSETVELLNEYLKDDFEDENNSIKSQEISNEEIKIEITQKNEEVHQSTFISELTFTEIHTTTLELFAKSNFSIPQNELEVFAKSKGVFKNQLIESINDTCYEFLDDVLIEEEDDYYTINTNYFQKISIQ
jgi:hypothetical protein